MDVDVSPRHSSVPFDTVRWITIRDKHLESRVFHSEKHVSGVGVRHHSNRYLDVSAEARIKDAEKEEID